MIENINEIYLISSTVENDKLVETYRLKWESSEFAERCDNMKFGKKTASKDLDSNLVDARLLSNDSR